MTYDAFKANLKSPCIVHWEENHFIVVYKIIDRKIYVADPSSGLLEYKKAAFCNGWLKKNDSYNNEGTVLFIEKSDEKTAK